MVTFKYYAVVDDEGSVVQIKKSQQGEDAPTYIGCTIHLLDGPYNWASQESPTQKLKWINNNLTWVETATLDIKKQAKIEAMNKACEAQILDGFTSDALGGIHTYPAKILDQHNLAMSVLDSFIPEIANDWSTPFWCADANGLWEMRPHTALQIRQVGRNGKGSIIDASSKNELKRAEINAATTIQELDLITW